MALLKAEGFDAIAANGASGDAFMKTRGFVLITSDGGNPGDPLTVLSTDTATGVGMSIFPKTGGGNNTGGFIFPLNENVGEIYVNFRFKLSGSVPSIPIFQASYNNLLGNTVYQLSVITDGQNGFNCGTVTDDAGQPNAVGAWQGIAATPANTVFPGIWQYAEIHYKPDPSAGLLEVKIDGALVIEFSGQTSLLHWPSSVNQVSWIGDTNMYIQVDDITINDTSTAEFNSWSGDLVVHDILAVADAGPNQMSQVGGTPGAGNHFTQIDEQTSDEDGSYLTSNTAGDTELFTLATFPSDMVDVLSVAVNIRAKKDATGVGMYEAVIISGTTEVDGPSIAAAAGYNTSQTIFPTAPGGGAWTLAGAQALKIGGKLV
jgi:hypothetical protein